MKTVLILRHAKSSWANQKLGDHDRPLNERGQADASRLGQLLRQEGLVPDKVISSTAERALNTAQLVALGSGYEGNIEATPRFYLAPPQAYLAYLEGLPDENRQVLVVGHNPGVAELLLLLTGQEESFPTATLAHVELPIDRWEQLTELTPGQLVKLWEPKG